MSLSHNGARILNARPADGHGNGLYIGWFPEVKKDGSRNKGI